MVCSFRNRNDNGEGSSGFRYVDPGDWFAWVLGKYFSAGGKSVASGNPS
jgi:hypothetical protein